MTSLAAIYPPPRSVRPLGQGRVAVGEPTVEVDPALAGDRFTIRATDAGVFVAGGSPRALGYADEVLRSLVDSDGRVPEFELDDEPEFAVRGVTIDVSRDRVPTLDTLRDLIDRLGRWRYNHLELYIEHTFAYEGHDEVWREASPYTAHDLEELDAYCAARGLDLVVQQNCLGHMERWLAHQRYAHLAATPGGYRDDQGNHEPAATLDPTSDEAFDLVAGLLAQMDQVVPAGRPIHLGLDEPLDLNPALWERIFHEGVLDASSDGGFVVQLPPERQQQYIAWLQRLRRLDSIAGREMLIWADVASANPAVLAAVPPDVTLVEWGYEDGHPWDDRCTALRAWGGRYMVCAGTSSWSGLAGRPDVAHRNLRDSANAARRSGAAGYLVADWGDGGHHQFPVFAEAVFALGAAYAWNTTAADALDWADVVDRQVLDSAPGGGDLILRLGMRGDELSAEPTRHCLLTALLGETADVAQVLRLPAIERALIEADLALAADRAEVDRLHSGRRDADTVRDELLLTIDWFQHGIHRALATEERLSLIDEFAQLLDRQSQLWLARNRSGGLKDSLAKISPPKENS